MHGRTIKEETIVNDTLVLLKEFVYNDNGDLTVTYNYNTEGLRTAKNVNGTTYKYTWNGTNLTHQAWGNEYIHFYYDSNNSILGFTYFDGTTSSDYTYIKNIQGDVVGISLSASGLLMSWGNSLPKKKRSFKR